MSDSDALEIVGLGRKERAFVTEMLVDNDPVAAAIRAGYDVVGLDAVDITPDELLADPRIGRALDAARAQQSARVQLQQHTILREMSLLALSSLEHFTVDEDGYVSLAPGAPDGAIRALQSIKRKVTTKTEKDGSVTRTVDVELRLWDKPNPLKLMGRHVGLFPDRVEVTGKDGGPLAGLTDEQLAERAATVAALARRVAEGVE
jgi:phage terminase small subunit